MIPGNLKYTQDHEWISVEGDEAVIGITAHAVSELGEIVCVDLPEVGDELDQSDEFGSVESVKTLSSLFSPVGGEVIATNSALQDNPGSINDSPYEDGWLVKVRIADSKEVDDLLSSEEYEGFLEDQSA